MCNDTYHNEWYYSVYYAYFLILYYYIAIQENEARESHLAAYIVCLSSTII